MIPLLKPESIVQFSGTLDDKNISGLSFWRGFALIVTDEATLERGNVVQLFERTKNGYSAVKRRLVGLDLKTGGKNISEMDLEGVAIDGDDVYVLGSHSWRRKKVSAEASYAANRKALMSKPRAEPSRDVLLKFSMSSSKKPSPIQRTSLRSLFKYEPFASFRSIASKENGIDAEGLAFYDGHLYVGFRGPVLRGNFAPVMKLRFSTTIKKYELLFVNLGGRGIRDLAHTEDGLLMLAGPVGDGPGSYQLYHWNGLDCVPGNDLNTDAAQHLQLLGDLVVPNASAKAEGLALESESPTHWDVIIVFDGATDGEAARYSIKRPNSR